jgi:hypothetical protein
MIPDTKTRLLAGAKEVGGCWEWQRKIDKYGYGHVSIDGKLWLAHRAFYALFKCEIPSGMHIDHLCRNTRCVNPDHLEPVTQAENNRRAKRTHCKRGHEFTQDNRYPDQNGKRICRACSIENSRAYSMRKRARAEANQ